MENKEVDISQNIVSSSLSPPPPALVKNDYVDKLTLELMTNKTHYNKYLSQSNPVKYREQVNHLQKIKKYKSRILEMTERLFNNPETQINLEINEMFTEYAKTMIRYFEMKELDKSYSHEGEDEDEDTLFGNCKDNISEEEEEEEEPMIDLSKKQHLSKVSYITQLHRFQY